MRVLNDFRSGALGAFCLELTPKIDKADKAKKSTKSGVAVTPTVDTSA